MIPFTDYSPSPAHPAVQDLYWAINSQSPYALAGITAWHDGSAWFSQFIAQLCDNPQPLLDFLGTKRRILGHYFEALWQFYVTHNPRYRLLASNIQLIIQGTTLGEIDLLLYDQHQQCTLHVELACKFYLAVVSPNQPHAPALSIAHASQWIGTGKTDRLSDKYHNLVHKQLNLAHNPLVQALLAKQNLHIDQSIAILKGRSFIPLAPATWLSGITPQGKHAQTLVNGSTYNTHTLHTSAKQAVWLHSSNIALLPTHYLYAPLTKNHWLANNSPHTHRLLSRTQLLAHIHLNPLPTQVACFNPHHQPLNQAQAGRAPRLVQPQQPEALRLFVVPQGW